MVRRGPPALDGKVSARMATYRQRDTGPERELRSAMFRHGLRYFVHRPPLPSLRTRADVIFPRARVAVYVHGCFWHGCPHHGTWPRHNAEWWREKIQKNQARDRATTEALKDAGWAAVVVWEHEDLEQAASEIADLVASRRRRENGDA
jgi:DNA mismatch endonuclease (patch repair protein)